MCQEIAWRLFDMSPGGMQQDRWPTVCKLGALGQVGLGICVDEVNCPIHITAVYLVFSYQSLW